MVSKNGQVALEYVTIMGFVSFILIIIIGGALFYSGGVKDRIKSSQITNCANKIISTSERIFYAGEPSRATITCFLPNNVNDVEIIDNSLFFTFSSISGVNKIAYYSNVPISGNLSFNPELNKFSVVARESYVEIARI
jgi:hypothetical protein